MQTSVKEQSIKEQESVNRWEQMVAAQSARRQARRRAPRHASPTAPAAVAPRTCTLPGARPVESTTRTTAWRVDTVGMGMTMSAGGARPISNSPFLRVMGAGSAASSPMCSVLPLPVGVSTSLAQTRRAAARARPTRRAPDAPVWRAAAGQRAGYALPRQAQGRAAGSARAGRRGGGERRRCCTPRSQRPRRRVGPAPLTSQLAAARHALGQGARHHIAGEVLQSVWGCWRASDRSPGSLSKL